MENGAFNTSTDLKKELIVNLKSFTCVYSLNRERLQTASKLFTLRAAKLRETPENGCECKIVQGLFALSGGVLGVLFGSVTGGACGVFGAISAATLARLCDDINALGATVGFVGSVLGGVVGGAFGGIVGGSASCVARVKGSPLDGLVSDAVWFSIGCATGGAIGGIFGGMVGTAGGGMGGAFGALYGVRITSSLVGSVVSSANECSQAQTVKDSHRDFMDAVEPLVKELKTLKAITDKMASSGFVHSVAAQTEKTLASVTTMEKTIGHFGAADLPQSTAEEAARQCKTVAEEMETTRAGVEKLLDSLGKR